MSSRQVWESVKNHNCVACRQPVVFDAVSGWYHIPGEGRIVHDGGCYWQRLVRKGLVRGSTVSG